MFASIAPTPSNRHTAGLKNRRENTVAPRTVGKKPLVFQTPRVPSKSQKTPFLLQTTTRPLHDKTPFTNRIQQFQTPAPDSASPSKKPSLASVSHGEFPAQSRPSSTRRHSRAPRSSGKNFETSPANAVFGVKQRAGALLLAQDDPVVQSIESQNTRRNDDNDDDDELEFCPPNTLDLPYQPPFDFELPDYAQVGKLLQRFDRRVEEDVVYDCCDNLPLPGPDELPDFHVDLPRFETGDDDDDDDPFAAYRKQKESVNSAKPMAATRGTTLRPFSRTAASTVSKVSATNDSRFASSRPAASTRVGTGTTSSHHSSALSKVKTTRSQELLARARANTVVSRTTVQGKTAQLNPRPKSVTSAARPGTTTTTTTTTIPSSRPHSAAIRPTSRVARGGTKGGILETLAKGSIGEDFMFET